MACFVAALLAMTEAGVSRHCEPQAKQSILRRWLGEAFIQICPVRIHRFDERDFSLARAALDLLLAGYRFVHPFVSFVEDEPIAAVAARESRRQTLAMREDALAQIRSDASVKRPT